jgi:hypothetical protein
MQRWCGPVSLEVLMQPPPVHVCQCPKCRSRKPHPERALHHQINLLLSRLDEQQRRWYVALESNRVGHGGDRLLAEITGLSEHTIRRGRRELDSELADRPLQHVRAAGGGRPAAEEQDPALEPTLEALLASETAGDPMGRRAKAKRSSLRRLSAALTAAGHPTSHPTVSRLLRQLGYSPKANARRKEAKSSSPERNKQFEYIAAQRRRFLEAGEPVISVDTKKKGADR